MGRRGKTPFLGAALRKVDRICKLTDATISWGNVLLPPKPDTDKVSPGRDNIHQSYCHTVSTEEEGSTLCHKEAIHLKLIHERHVIGKGLHLINHQSSHNEAWLQILVVLSTRRWQPGNEIQTTVCQQDNDGRADFHEGLRHNVDDTVVVMVSLWRKRQSNVSSSSDRRDTSQRNSHSYPCGKNLLYLIRADHS